MPALEKSLGTTSKASISGAFILPGLPHLVFGKGPYQHGWQPLKDAMVEAGKRAQASQPDVLILYSAQWISVLGHSFQVNPNPKGFHVDENWYTLDPQADYTFDFKVDVALSERAAELAKQKGLATMAVNYEGFPIDTGTLTVLKYLNPDNTIPVVILSSNIYCGREDTEKLGEAVSEALTESGKKAVLVNCSSLSYRFLTEDIQPEADQLASPTDDAWNRKILDLLAAGKAEEVLALSDEYVKAANPEMQFKGFYWLMAALRKDRPSLPPAEVLAYGPIWGTGAAVVAYNLN